jgi:hypothetical protein
MRDSFYGERGQTFGETGDMPMIVFGHRCQSIPQRNME